VKFEKEVVIAPEHPSLPGHFPGQPIVPGVVILDEIVAALSEWQSTLRVIGMTQVKFLAPLLPAQPMRIALSEASKGRVSFECRADDTLLVTGQFRISQYEA
jgi:3-hydroxymyristoyl/3-hydroxydecanoyl-(acyl carrier protein) dehydratase